MKPLKRQIGVPRVLTGIWLDAMGPTPLGTACERHYATISVASQQSGGRGGTAEISAVIVSERNGSDDSRGDGGSSVA